MGKKKGIGRWAKRGAAVLLCAASLLAGVPLPAASARFSDVPEGAWYAKYVDDLVGKGILSGTTATTFSPNATLTRAAFATMLARSYLTDADAEAYRYTGSFTDVPASFWGNRYINWAQENGVVSGVGENRFAPDRAVTRQEMAAMVLNFSKAVGRKMPAIRESVTFTDYGDVSNFARSAVLTCQMAGVLTGYKDGSFRPKGVATRSEAASLVSNFLKNCPASDQYTIIRKRVNGTAVRAVAFDPSRYAADLVMGRDVADGGEAPASMIQRTGAVIAVNGAFFDMGSYQALGTLVKESRVVTTFERYSPEKSALVLDGEGRFTIRNFKTEHTAILHKRDTEEQSEPEEAQEEALEEEADLPTIAGISVNRWPNSATDASRILFTRDWGHELAFTAKDAVTVSAQGVILSVDHDTDVAIPEDGFVLAQRARREYEGDFFDSCQVGDTIEIQRVYQGLGELQPVLSIGAGPRIAKDGAVYGNAATYRSEGFTDPNIVSYSPLRVAVGIKPDGGLVLITCYATLEHLGQILVSMGCSDAINFDGGGSVNLYVDGFWLRGPQDRRLNNLLVFKKRSQ